jgi:class 3 adenylate cyclase/predicted ATPase
MFCDLVGSTALSGQIDPEELNEVTLAYHSACAEVIERHAGRIAQFLRDGLLVYFGYPIAHEDDAQRAIRAGLEIVGAVSSACERLRKPLQVRVGVHTGLVVVGQFGGEANSDPMAVSGEAPNIAARLQGIAEPGQVVVSAATYRLIEGFFQCRSLGTPRLRGVSTPIEAFEVVEPTGIHTRFERAVASGLTPFVGREEEFDRLLHDWEDAARGNGRVVMLSGEPGIGKSRLLRELKDRTSGEWINEFEARCSPYYQNSALYPAIDVLQRMLRFTRSDDPDSKLAKLEEGLAQFDFSLPEVVPLFAALLSLPLNDRYPALWMTPMRQKQKTFEAIIAFLLRSAEWRPTRVIVEDLHWADPSTLELLELIIEQASHTRLFVVLAFRPEFVPPWPALPQVTSISLGRLARSDRGVMVRSVAGGKALPASVVDEIASKTEGVPLFIEELTRMVLESGLLHEHNGVYQRNSSAGTLAIPSTLNDSLMARLDRLGTAKEVAQIAAIIGREFSYELLRAIAPREEARLTGALNRLVDAELLEEYSPAPRFGYRFKHALIRDAAYESLLRSKRQQLHRQVGEAIETIYAGHLEEHLAELANHFRLSNDSAQAINYLRLAGEQANRRGANAEALQLLSAALELIARQVDGPDRARHELETMVVVSSVLIASKGYAAPELDEALNRMLWLCKQIDDPLLSFFVYFHTWVFASVRGEHVQRAYDLSNQLMTMAERLANPTLIVWANIARGNTDYHMGRMASARLHLEKAIELDVPALLPGAFEEPRALAGAYLGPTLWYVGYPDRAVAASLAAIDYARQKNDPFSEAHATFFLAAVMQLRRDPEAALRLCEQTITLSTDHGFPIWLGQGQMWKGWSLSHLGHPHEGITQLAAGIATYANTGARLGTTYWAGLRAETYLQADENQKALESASEVAELVAYGGEGIYEAELYRLKGVALLRVDPSAAGEVEAAFRRAIEIAQRTGTKSWELRAATSLANLLKQQNRGGEGRRVLAEVYKWFTEGFETGDLKDARALLAELS